MQVASNKTRQAIQLAVGVALCHDAYNEIVLNAPNTAGEQQTMMVTIMPDTGASMCLFGRCVTMRMGITRHELAKTIKRLVGANGGQIKQDNVEFRNLTVGDATSSRLV